MAGKTHSKLIIISAPSGAGKTSLSKRTTHENNDIQIAISHTTRSPRLGETYGQEYYFVDNDEFKALIKADRFLEYAKVFDHFYGTSKMAVQKLIDQGKHVLLEIDWQGARNIRQIMPDSISVFILPPSRDALVSRLTGRGQDSQQTIERRMLDALNQIGHYDEYDYVIVNDDFDQAFSELKSIIYEKPYCPHISNEAVDELVISLMKNQN